MSINSSAYIAPFTWSVVIPVKVLTQAKSRLARLGGERRAELALAMAADTVTAVLACPAAERVIVITDDQVAGRILGELGADVIPDSPTGGLNAALRHGAAFAREHWPKRGVAALFADLPAVRAADITAALDAARQWPTAFVADSAGDGTTMYTARPGAGFEPSFGLASRARHAASGAIELELDGIDGLRRDVDTPEDLQQAAAMGLGVHTAGLLRCAPRGR
ncbi:MAG TPA: 2-phospho-L-lactate guanylyltransferase [Streptosporangiaceae bacterium]